MNHPLAKLFRLSTGLRPTLSLSILLLSALLLPNRLAAQQVTDLRADSALVDGKTGQTLYHGNALLKQENFSIRADDIEATQSEAGNLKSGRFRGNPAVLVHTDPTTGATSEARAQEILYDAESGRTELLTNAFLLQQDPRMNRKLQLEGTRIELVQTGTQLNNLAASGSPVRFSRTEDNAQPIHGQANTLRYLGANEQLALEGEAKLQQGTVKFEHVVIEYDGVNKRITAPKRDGQQVKITRLPETGAGSESNPSEAQPNPSQQNKDTP